MDKQETKPVYRYIVYVRADSHEAARCRVYEAFEIPPGAFGASDVVVREWAPATKPPRGRKQEILDWNDLR